MYTFTYTYTHIHIHIHAYIYIYIYKKGILIQFFFFFKFIINFPHWCLVEDRYNSDLPWDHNHYISPVCPKPYTRAKWFQDRLARCPDLAGFILLFLCRPAKPAEP